MNLPLTDTEAQNLVTLLDAATKAGGLQAAMLALPLFNKLQAAANAPADDITIEAETV
jgi:hypothetical protein